MSNPPFKLDMSFSEALKRFAQTDPKETIDDDIDEGQGDPPQELEVLVLGTASEFYKSGMTMAEWSVQQKAKLNARKG